MLKSKKIARTLDTHRYTLRRGVVKHDDGTLIADLIAISMGEHGVMDSHPVHDLTEKSRATQSGDRLKELASHNIAETRRAMEESEKWKMRLRESPLGKTQQDFVAYYTEVIALFTEWHTANDVLLPE